MTYQALAPIYDRIMGHVAYHAWAELVVGIARETFVDRSVAVLELGGGTGIVGRELVDSGQSYAGSDFEFAMCREARKRHLRVFCADARHLPVRPAFDMILFLYDGINYLLSMTDYRQVFREAYRCLRPGGLFLFDVTTEANSLKYFRDRYDAEDLRDHYYFRHSYYDYVTHSQYNDFVIFREVENGLYRRAEEHHAQRVFAPELIKENIPRDKFEVVGMWDGISRAKYSRRSERVSFLLRKQEAHSEQ